MPLIYGHDFSDVSTGLAPGAAALAARLRLPLVLVHVREPTEESLDPEAEARIATRARERLESLASDLTRAWPACGARAVQVRGRPAGELAAAAARERAELLVVSSGRHTGPLWRLGSTSERVAVEAECPVLVLRASEPFEAWARGERRLRLVLGVSDDAAFAGAVAWTSRLRSAAACDVTAAEVYSPPEEQERYGLASRIPWTEPDPELERLVARDLARRLGTLGGEGAVEIRPKLGLGRPADHLLDVAERVAADLVVVGTHRTRGFLRLASVSEGVLHHGRTSVLLVPGVPGTARVAVPQLRRVMVAVDLSPSSPRAVAQGLSLARASRGELHLLHVVELEEPPPSEAIALAARMRALVPEPAGVPVRTDVIGAREPAEAIIAAAERLDADVVCIAPHSRSTVERLALGSVAERVVRGCRRPVLVVHPQRE
jgi:nucleotide-binding universal stress UspA family protein